MDPAFVALLGLAAFAAGALNAVAGGGSFLTFPALVLTGVPPLRANATSAAALWPASIASALAYRRDLTHSRRELVLFGIVSLLGGLVGALLLLLTPEERFGQLVPWLLLVATFVFALGPTMTKQLRARQMRAPLWMIVVVQLAIAIYGGYFGGGMGIMMLAAFSALGMEDIHSMNGLKAILGTALNGIAIVAFVVAGVVVWQVAFLMSVAGVAGGWFGARGSRRVEARYLRAFVVVVGAALTAYFFLRG
ncbi:MAG TPA: sulfite exporter TauE/SafE family protein [Candidatus Thermoplasmatota archaeon]|nr:sulfite exporter TauE/SafE family protein [Candidatus Thermoplasmatota archaeon]